MNIFSLSFTFDPPINSILPYKASVHMAEQASHQPLPQHPIQLTPAQYERLFFQPGEGPRREGLSKTKSFGNPTAFAIISYLLALTPTVCILMSWDGGSNVSHRNHCGILDFRWSDYWLSLGVLFDPSKGIASAFTDGTNSPAFNYGLQFYFTFWAILCILYLIASVRTNIVFMYVFLTLVFTFAFLAAAYRQAGLGDVNMSLTFLKTAGAFGFANIVGGCYLAVVLIFAAVDMPFAHPLGDLSGFL
ncbi:hypothetical protein B0H19DRAFT_1274378 [Mycena capillaripes]|nr:hypothetical protein B0H19DRAFT_1274378 [Mycena capillaripes]